MTLGQRIYQLRTKMHLSQGDLADKLEVSRQSVSKWETDASVPELDKLVRLSQLFGVTLDSLVIGAEPTPQPEPTAQPAPEPESAPARWSGRKIAGWALIALGVVIVVLFLALTGSLAGTIFSLPLFLCGLICLTVRRHPGLWCAWVLFLLTDGYWRYATGVTWHLIWLTPIFEPSWNYARLALGWGEAILALALAVGTALCLGEKAPGGPKGTAGPGGSLGSLRRRAVPSQRSRGLFDAHRVRLAGPGRPVRRPDRHPEMGPGEESGEAEEAVTQAGCVAPGFPV